MIAALLDHLWQSTLLAGVAALLALMLRGNSARVRYWIWFGASAKFLVPFAALTALAELALAPFKHSVATPIYWTLQPAAQPFTAAPVLSAADAALPAMASAALLVWALGAAILSAAWLVRWSRLRLALRGAATLELGLSLPVRSTATMMEPGLVGLWRPVILLPRGIETALSAAELDAILAHELCHWRRRDNLMAAAHMLVTTVFWFHPMVWWIGARMVAERENACDESVLAAGNNPRTYAECILKVCRFYLQSPLPCAAGVAGADLRKRVEAIMANRPVADMDGARSLLLALTACAALLLPPVAGVLTTAPRQMAQLAERIAQAMPRAALLPVALPVARPVAPVPTIAPAQTVIPQATPHAVLAVALRDTPMDIQPAQLAETAMAAPAGAGDTVCRQPQILAHTRLRGPVTCAARSRWAELKAKGLDFAPDGHTIIAEPEKPSILPPCLGIGVNSTVLGSVPNPCL